MSDYNPMVVGILVDNTLRVSLAVLLDADLSGGSPGDPRSFHRSSLSPSRTPSPQSNCLPAVGVLFALSADYHGYSGG